MLGSYGIFLADDEFKTLLQKYDTDHDGKISQAEFHGKFKEVLQPSSAVPGPLGLHDPYLVEDGVGLGGVGGIGGEGAQTDDRRSVSPRLNSPRLTSPRLASSRLSPRLSPRPGTSGSVRSNASRVSNASRASFGAKFMPTRGVQMGQMGRQAGKPPRRPLPPTGGVPPLPSRMVRIEGDSAESPNLFPGASGATLAGAAGAARSGVGSGVGSGAGSGGAQAGARARTGTPQSNAVAPETITRIQVTRAMRTHPLSTGVY